MRQNKWASILCILMSFLVTSAFATEPPKEPLLRIEAGQHTGMITRIAVDGAGRYLVTSSQDKTVRVWESASGTLLRVIRPPQGEGDEGKLYSVALSPDGGTIACGGWTKLGSDSGYTIYLFNRSTGSLLRRITGLPNVILHLAFSPDGRYLAASLGGANGIRVYSMPEGREQFKDSGYVSNSYGVAFDRSGRLAATCDDGSIRLYSADFTKIATVTATGGKEPHSLAFSSDGSRIAVGYDATNRVDILSGRDLSLLSSADTSGIGSEYNLGCVAWSADGRQLFAGGRYPKNVNGQWHVMIRRWEDGGRGAFTDLPASNNTSMSLAPLPGGKLAFGAQDPAFGILGKDGAKVLFSGPESADFRDIEDNFRLASDGQQVRFGYEHFGKSPARFSLVERKLSQNPAADSGLEAPLTSHAELNVTDWEATYTPKLNGAPLKLKQYERSRSLAFLPDGSGFLLGTEWYLRLFGPDGREKWRVPAPEAVWGVNVTWQARLAVAAYGDGTIRWHRLSDGKELLAFFPHKDRKRWVLWTPSGYYDASPGGEELIGWHVNNGKDQAADFYPASKFRSTYYRPDVIDRILKTLDEGEAVRLANAESGRKEAKAIANLLPPVVSISSPADGISVNSNTITLRYSVRSPSDVPVTAVRVLVDGRPISTDRGLKVVPKDGSEQTITVTIPERDCEVSVIAENRHSSSVATTVRLTWNGKKQEEFAVQPKLYLLAVGVSAYKDPSLTLKYAAKDARDFAASVLRQKGGLYRDVVVKTLADATKDDILDGLDWLQKEVTAKDVGIIFLAGHGVNDSSGTYYYLPANADPDKLKRTGVAFSDIKNTVASIAGKALMFVDTCHSGNVMGSRRGIADINAVVNELSSAENGVVVFASSTGRQYSLEDDKWGNGAFTKALVEGISDS